MKSYSVLDKVDTPADVKRMPAEQLPELCTQIREFLIDSVSKTGGHLASNLGAVEISVALHRVYSSPDDKIMFDVGHQSYVHKMLTGRKGRFDTLRKLDGISGFLRPTESEHDCFVTGHASNSISAALGMARGIAALGRSDHVVCVVGDGALTGGMTYEALNDAGSSGLPIVIIANDNEMSIGKNVGALATRLSHMRLKPQYFRLKSRTKKALGRYKFGDKIIKSLSKLKSNIRKSLLKETIFELMGLKYLGPADGNDINTVVTLLNEAKNAGVPVVVHLKTTKGKGYLKSEEDPGHYHGVSAFDVVTGNPINKGSITFSDIFGANMCAFAESDKNLVAITAAMEAGTGLEPFAERFHDRFFDVGIAEGHAVTMAAGIASTGVRAVCAIYSTFLQRSYDQLIHDVAIQKNHVVFAIDRCGLVGEDGQTHQGVFDISFLSSIPGVTIFTPSSHLELSAALKKAIYYCNGPVVVRYPRGSEGEYKDNSFENAAVKLCDGSSITIVSYGIMINQAIIAQKELAKLGISVEIIKLNCVSNIDFDIIRTSVLKTRKMIILEDCMESGCVGQRISVKLVNDGVAIEKLKLLNLKNNFIPEGKASLLWERYGIDAAAVVRCAVEEMSFGG